MPKAKSPAKSPAAKAEEPRTFSLHWGNGIIEEEVRIGSTYHHPTIQLLKFTEGSAKGTREIRFCHYNHRGQFQRSPLIIDEKDIPALRKALNETPKLKGLLKKLIG
ncbi:MAG TPA: hypothetical protein VN656_14920 [Stellaceae bacterium]|jgi:hypothetical protein|nr:hypothetical protein [Stellaceae bacterium]